MKLYWSSRSPFVRKVMVAAHETGLAGRIRTERVVVGANNPNAEVMAVNPLNKIPTLILDDGSALYDSRVICEYLDTLHASAKLFPADTRARFTALRRQALGDGLMEVILLRLGEQARPAATQSEKHLSTYRLKIATTLDRLETEADGLADALSIGHIAIGCALAHLDFRFAADDWRAGRTKLARWHGDFACRPSMQATEYVDAY
jgi:glutathione S-transferase